MKTQKTFLLNDFCIHYDIPESFINALYNYDLIEIIEKENTQFIMETEIRDIEKMIRLHYDLQINIEGVHAINNLLNKVDALKQEIALLQKKLNFHQSV